MVRIQNLQTPSRGHQMVPIQNLQTHKHFGHIEGTANGTDTKLTNNLEHIVRTANGTDTNFTNTQTICSNHIYKFSVII